MSLASDILRRAIESSHAHREDHARSVRDVAARFADHLGKPWKWRLEAIENGAAEGDDEEDTDSGEEST